MLVQGVLKGRTARGKWGKPWKWPCVPCISAAMAYPRLTVAGDITSPDAAGEVALVSVNRKNRQHVQSPGCKDIENISFFFSLRDQVWHLWLCAMSLWTCPLSSILYRKQFPPGWVVIFLLPLSLPPPSLSESRSIIPCLSSLWGQVLELIRHVEFILL